MASHLVAQHQLSSYASPDNGQAGDATVVLGNDNTTVTGYNTHDSDGTIHVQDSSAAVFAAIPAGTQGRKWMTNDASAIYLYFDNGSSWVEANYLRNTGGSVAGNVAVTGTLTVTSASAAAVTVGRQGATSPAFKIDASAATSVTGIEIVVAAAAAGVNLRAISSGTDENLTVNAKGAGTITLNPTGTGNVVSTRAFIASNGITATAGTGTVTCTTVTATNLGGTLSTATQNSVTTMTGLTTIGTLVAGAVPASLVTAGTLGSGNFTLSGTAILTATTVSATTLTGTLSTAAQPNVTSVGTLTSLTVNGPITITRTSLQLAVQYDASNHLGISVASNGTVTYNATGAGAAHAFSDPVDINAILTVTTGGLTVSSGTTAVQALTATTGAFSSTLSAKVTSLSRSDNVGDVVLTLTNSNATATNQYGAYIQLTGDPNDATRYFIRADGNTTPRFVVYSNGSMVTTGGATLAGALSGVTTLGMSSTLTMSAAASKIVPGATSFAVRNNADGADNILVSDAGALTVRTSITTGASGVGSAQPWKLGEYNTGTPLGSVDGTKNVHVNINGTDVYLAVLA